MSSPAFSHQFSQRWIATLAPVKAVILQELEDIATLLHPDTDLATFNFSTQHLHEKIDNIEQVEAQRLAKLYADEAEKEQVAAEQVRQQKLQVEAAAKAEQEKIIQEHQQVKPYITDDILQQMEDYIQLSLQETAEKLRSELRPWLEAEMEKQLTARLAQTTK